MTARNGISILHRHRYALRSFSSCQQRLISSSNCEPFVLPRLVIDLDAADSTLVRRWEEKTAQENGGQDSPRHKSSKRQRDVRRNAKPGRVRIEESQRQQSHIGPLMPCDVLSFAILGHPATQKYSEAHAANVIFQRSGIMEKDSDEVIVQQLATMYSVNLPRRPTQAGIWQNLKEDLKRLIETCEDFSKLKRTVAMLSSTTEGCQFLVQHEKSVLQGIRRCRFASRKESASQRSMVSCSMVLKLLNNLKLSLEPKGIVISSDLCNAGIYYASGVPSLPAIKEYLSISLLNSYPVNAHTTLGLMQLQQLFHTGWKDTETPLQHATCKDVVTIITGLREDCDPQKLKIRDISFASLLRGEAERSPGSDIDQNLYFTYIQGLGELGHVHALWAEFEAGEAHRPHLVRTERHRVNVARSFALACTVAGDSKSALSILQTVYPVPESEASEDEEASRGQMNYRWLISALDTHYRSRNLSPTKDLSDKIKDEFRNLPKDPERTLKIFEKFVANKAMSHAEGATVPAGDLVYRQD